MQVGHCTGHHIYGGAFHIERIIFSEEEGCLSLMHTNALYGVNVPVTIFEMYWNVAQILDLKKII